MFQNWNIKITKTESNKKSTAFAERLRENKIYPKKLFNGSQYYKSNLRNLDENMEEPDFEAQEIQEVHIKFEGSLDEY